MESSSKPSQVSAALLVERYLRGQNLEQIGKTDEAIGLYEEAVASGFDSSGPYDRLIAVYNARAGHNDVIRVTESALEHVHTHQDKRAWYERTRAEARKALARVPLAVPKAAPHRRG